MSMTKGQGSVVALTLVATLGGLLFGYDTAVISGAVKSIDANFIDPQGLEETARNSLSGFTIASALIGCVIGGAIAGWVGNHLGRKGGLMVAAVMFLVSADRVGLSRTGLGHDRRDGAGRPDAFHRLSHHLRHRRRHGLDAVAPLYRRNRPARSARQAGLL